MVVKLFRDRRSCRRLFFHGGGTFRRDGGTFGKGRRTFFHGSGTFFHGAGTFRRGSGTFLHAGRTFLRGRKVFVCRGRTAFYRPGTLATGGGEAPEAAPPRTAPARRPTVREAAPAGQPRGLPPGATRAWAGEVCARRGRETPRPPPAGIDEQRSPFLTTVVRLLLVR